MSWRWLLAIIAFAMLFAFGVSMWWFGPLYATRVLGVWMVLTGPLFLVTYPITRARWMLYLGFSLVSLGLLSLLLPLPYWSWWQETGGAFASVVGLACAIPLIVTLAWTLAVFPEPGYVGPRPWLVRTGGPILLTSFTIFATSVWAVADSQDPVAMPQYTQNFVGCYELDFGRWIPGGDEAGRAIARIVPARIRLDATRARGGMLIQPPTWWGSAFWMPTGARRIRILYGDGFGSLDARLYRWGHGFRGRVIAYSDADGYLPEPRALVDARPTDCSGVSTDTLRYITAW